MSELAHLQPDRVRQVCEQNAAEIADSLNRCFETAWRLQPAEQGDWDQADQPADLDQAGMILELQVGDARLLCLFPASLPLPAWYGSPNEAENVRLQELAAELPAVLLPDDLDFDESTIHAVENLASAVDRSQPASRTHFAALDVQPENAESTGEQPPETADEQSGATPKKESSEAAAARILLLWPVTKSIQPEADVGEQRPAASSAPESPVSPQTPAVNSNRRKTGAALLRNLPVTVAVRIAEKKIELEHLLALTAGSLITFNKPCDDLLDLYVNNHHYCRGEAVKIGEKFGLRVTEVGVKPTREPRVLN